MTPAVLETDARWLEVRFGAAEGLTFDEIEASYPDLAARLAGGAVDIDWPAGEIAMVLHDRVAAAWSAVVAAARPTVVVTHAGPMRIAVALASGRAPGDVPLPGPAEAVLLEVETAGRPGRAARTGR